MTLQEKIMEAFQGKVVRKDLAFMVKGNLPVPTYVLEYLLGQYCASDDEQIIDEGLEKVKSVIRNNYVNRADAEMVKGKIHEAGKYRVIDKVSVVLSERIDCYVASFANLGLTGIPIDTNYVRVNPKLLSGNGVWCIVTIGYIPGEDIKIHWEIQTLKPIQISNVDINEYISQRKLFTTDEWIDFIVHTVGLNPENLNRREKFIVLARLMPHIENNFNFMELGPKGTGKSHVFQELSPYGVLVSGGDVTSARLFVKMSGNKEILGLVGFWDVVAWDEYEQQKGKSVDPVLIDTMQNYLANKSFNRGGNPHEASASISFVGNTKHTVSYMLDHSHLFESIPTAFIKGAFLDRIHLFNPGWEVKILKKDSFSTGYGLITDYIAAVLHELRNIDCSSDMKRYVKFDASLSERDHLAIRKTFSGMVKLLYPDGIYTEAEAMEIIEFAAESRKRVKDQLYLIDETFKAEPAKFEYIALKTGQTRHVETLERVENGKVEEPMAVPAAGGVATAAGYAAGAGYAELAAGSAELAASSSSGAAFADRKDIAASDVNSTNPADPASAAASTVAASSTVVSASTVAAAPTVVAAPAAVATPAAELVAKQVDIRMNQRGVSYKSLFGNYMRTAKKIVLTDPFIRYPYQIDNLIAFIQMLRECSDTPEELTLELHTQNDEEKIPETIDILDELTEELSSYGLTFTYALDADHDRSIRTDNGWTITLGRGLDIFEPTPRYSLAAIKQENRRCKAFTATFIKEG